MIYAPFQDHHPPPFVKFFDIVTMIDGWLNDPRHIAVVHCIGGKGKPPFFKHMFSSVQAVLVQLFPLCCSFQDKRTLLKKQLPILHNNVLK